MVVKQIFPDDELWKKTINYSKNCNWSAGARLAKTMEENVFSEWEGVFVTINDNGDIIGYCVFSKTDCIPNVEYTPYISFIFVEERYRGQRISEKMILTVINYAKELQFTEIYVVSDHINLYEKYGFSKIDEKLDHNGRLESIYMRKIA